MNGTFYKPVMYSALGMGLIVNLLSLSHLLATDVARYLQLVILFMIILDGYLLGRTRRTLEPVAYLDFVKARSPIGVQKWLMPGLLFVWFGTYMLVISMGNR